MAKKETYRLEGSSAVVAILALAALLAACAARGNVRVVRLFAVGHGGRRVVRDLVGVVRVEPWAKGGCECRAVRGWWWWVWMWVWVWV